MDRTQPRLAPIYMTAAVLTALLAITEYQVNRRESIVAVYGLATFLALVAACLDWLLCHINLKKLERLGLLAMGMVLTAVAASAIVFYRPTGWDPTRSPDPKVQVSNSPLSGLKRWSAVTSGPRAASSA